MYEPLENKETLKKLRVDDCKKCGHPTLQFRCSPGVHQCLTCGTKWHYDTVEVKQIEGR